VSGADEDPLEALRAAADRSRSAARRAVADLARQRAALEEEHRGDPSYGTAARERARDTAGTDLGRPP